VHRVVSDDALRGRLVAAGRRRLGQLGLGPSTERLRVAVTRILADVGFAPAPVPVS
jgi:hypothetical protein